MRRLVTLIGGGATVAAAVLLAVPHAAFAAHGMLVVGQARYADPSGCYPVPAGGAPVVNYTDALVRVVSAADCSGPVVSVLGPGTTVLVGGGAVLVP